MRILIATGAYPPEIGGPATAMSALATELRAAGHEVVVLTYGETRQDPSVAVISRQGSVMDRYLRFASFARKLLPATDVVIVTDVFSVGIPVRLALMFKQTRLVLRLGGEWAWEAAVEKGRSTSPLRTFWKEQKSSWRMMFAKLNYRWIFGRASSIALTSDMLKEILSAAVPDQASKFITVWNSSDIIPEKLASDARPHAPLRLAYIGRFARVKNVPFFARALKAAIDQNAHVECVFAGNGETMHQSKDILHGISNMYFMGAVSHDALHSVLSEADLLVLPSLSDICPNTVIEALSAGVPCLITSEHGLPKPVAGCIELDPTDEKAWTEVIIRLASNKNVYVELRDEVKPIEFPQGKSLMELVVG